MVKSLITTKANVSSKYYFSDSWFLSVNINNKLTTQKKTHYRSTFRKRGIPVFIVSSICNFFSRHVFFFSLYANDFLIARSIDIMFTFWFVSINAMIKGKEEHTN